MKSGIYRHKYIRNLGLSRNFAFVSRIMKFKMSFKPSFSCLYCRFSLFDLWSIDFINHILQYKLFWLISTKVQNHFCTYSFHYFLHLCTRVRVFITRASSLHCGSNKIQKNNKISDWIPRLFVYIFQKNVIQLKIYCLVCLTLSRCLGDYT